MYHTQEGSKKEVEVERLQKREGWAVGLLIQHAPDKAREYILQDGAPAPEVAEVNEEQFLIEDPWFSDQRALHDRLGLSPEDLKAILDAKG